MGVLLEEQTRGWLEGSLRGGEPAGTPAWGYGLRNGFVCISRALSKAHQAGAAPRPPGVVQTPLKVRVPTEVAEGGRGVGGALGSGWGL